jgi:uncharacterized membrane protein YgdD (TMEM256/DUF423 family)
MAKVTRILAAVAALLGAAGVIEAAAAAHSIPNPLLKTASDFLIVNATAAIALSALAGASAGASRVLLAGIGMLIVGALLFGGELTSHVFLPQSPFVIAAPIGGTLTILGWLVSAAAILTAAPQRPI